jgi:hypothetical protein
VAPEVWSWVALGGWESVVARSSSGSWRWGIEHEGDAAGSERREPKGKMYFHKHTINKWASWAGRVGFGPREESGQRESGGP